MMSCNHNEVTKIVKFLHSIENEFEPVTQRTPYYHMGATITDSILQAGMNYKNVVYPRILNILLKYEDYRSTCDFIILFQSVPIQEIICWNNPKKQDTIKDLSWFLYNNNINDERDLSIWLKSEHNSRQLLNIKGIGLKTIDYLKLLTGLQEIPIDRHMFNF